MSLMNLNVIRCGPEKNIIICDRLKREVCIMNEVAEVILSPVHFTNSINTTIFSWNNWTNLFEWTKMINIVLSGFQNDPLIQIHGPLFSSASCLYVPDGQEESGSPPHSLPALR